MTTRREIILGAVMALSASLAAAMPQYSAPLEVTYYYLTG